MNINPLGLPHTAPHFNRKKIYSMKRMMVSVVFTACALELTALEPAHANVIDRDNGNEHADKKYQGVDEDIKRTQGERSKRRNFYTYKLGF